jgi:hypothetical protein
MFDEYLQQRAVDTGEPFRPFEIATDYKRYVNGKPRFDGPRDFLASCGIQLPEGTPWLMAFDGLKQMADGPGRACPAENVRQAVRDRIMAGKHPSAPRDHRPLRTKDVRGQRHLMRLSRHIDESR